MVLILSAPLLAAAKDKPAPPIVIPVTGPGQTTTTKLGNSYITRTTGGQSFTTTQLGSSTITRDSKGNTWTTTKLGNSLQTRANGGSSYSTTQLGNSLITRGNSSKKDDPQTRMIVLPRLSGQTQKP